MARLDGFYPKRDGFQTNLENRHDLGGLDRWGVRGALSSNFGVVHNAFVIDYFKSDSSTG
jgi:iron complex outermembrane receptor protein